MTSRDDWWVEGSYFEACNCDPVCPCRQRGDREGGRSTYGICDFALTWRVERGEADGVALGGFDVVLAGRYLDDEPGVPYRIALYIDERADSDQYDALEDIFLGQAGCANLEFLERTVDVYAARPARIRLDHTPDSQRVAVEDYVTIRTLEPVNTDETVSCGIPGHDRPGTEYRIEILRVDEPPLCWEVTGKTGFATDFAYSPS
jgi:hypothetical protein